MKLTFLGANRQVTGSCYCLEAAGKRIVVDCGMFQEREFQHRNWDRLAVDPKSIDVVLLTHAHLDHCGLLPKLFKDGFSGRVVGTMPSLELAELIMSDSARIQEEDMKKKARRHKKEGRKAKHSYEPLYKEEHVEPVVRAFQPVRYDKPLDLSDSIRVTFREAGHILGSALLEIVVTENGETRKIVFSGDVGQWNVPIVGDPEYIHEADYVVLESTYGDKDHTRPKGIREQIAEIVNETIARGGNVVIPTFAIERAQELLLHMAANVEEKRMPRIMTYLDSPMAVDATEIFLRHMDYMDEETRHTLTDGLLARARQWMHMCRSVEQSKAINSVRATAIIMAGSGMCTGGRIKHHLIQNISRPESTILFVGYQAHGTLGREILDQESPQVRILGRMWDVKARIERIEGLSAHAGRSDLLRWLEHYRKKPRHVFLTHGDMDAASSLAEAVRGDLGLEVSIPDYREEVELA